MRQVKSGKLKVESNEMERPRLVVRKSLRGMQIQIIKDDGKVMAGTWVAKKQALQATESIVKKAIKKGIKKVRFDRGKHRYHGWVKKIAKLARKAGLEL